MKDIKEKPVSVVISTYKRDNLLLITLRSILDQTYKNLQIIVVSDEESSITKKMIEKMNDNRIEHYAIPHSGRPAVPRNYGLTKVTGDYIAFCDDDDIWLPEKIQKQIDCFQQNPDIGLVYTDYVSFSDKGDVSRSSNLHTNIEQQIYHNKIPFSSVLIRRDVIDKAGDFDERMVLKASEDFLFLTKIISISKHVYLEQPLMRYRLNPQGISQIEGSVLKKIKYFIRLMICLREIFKLNQINLRRKVHAIWFHVKQTLKLILYPWYVSIFLRNRGKNV